MKFRVGNWKIDSKNLIRIHWKKYYPKLIVHEKFEKYIKWTLRIIGIIGILTCFLILPYEAGIALTFGIAIIEQLLERTLFEYSVMILQPFPDFNIDYDEWITNGYLLYEPEVENNPEKINFVGPTYRTKEYAIKFFNYIRSWNNDLDTDFENNICVSFIIESDVSYTTYLYANPDRKWLKPMFSDYEKSMQLKKYGKSQQSILMQMVFWKNKKMTEGMMFHQFTEWQKSDEDYYLAPFYIENDKLYVIHELKVLKNKFKYKGRSDLTENETEYHLK